MPVPAAPQEAVEAAEPAPPRPAAKSSGKKQQPETWLLKGEDGEEYGPIPRGELDDWHAEGRVTADCQLLRVGSDQWQWASDVYPDLGEEAPAAPAAFQLSPPAAETSEDDAPDDEPPAIAVTSNPSASRKKGAAAESSMSRHAVAVRGKKAVAAPPDDDEEADESDDDVSVRSKSVAGMLGIFLGPLGIHRFYLGYVGIGLAMLFTGGGCGIWSLIDAVLILLGKTPDAEGRELRD